jgi:hypothetical protein
MTARWDQMLDDVERHLHAAKLLGKHAEEGV